LEEPNIDPKDLEKIDAEVLVMAGSKDIIKHRHTEMIADKIPVSQLVIFENGNHFEPNKNPIRFNKTVLNFFAENALK
jgi:pimeloyl-ACP methyl ester carboxylesterase